MPTYPKNVPQDPEIYLWGPQKYTPSTSKNLRWVWSYFRGDLEGSEGVWGDQVKDTRFDKFIRIPQKHPLGPPKTPSGGPQNPSGPPKTFPKYLWAPQEAESRPRCRRLQLKDIIPTEMQRLTKYPLLLLSITKCTGEGSQNPPGPQKAPEPHKNPILNPQIPPRSCS